MSKQKPTPNYNLMVAISMHTIVIAQALEGYLIRYCPQHYLLGFQAKYDPNKWRFLGKKWHELAEEFQYCGARYCPTMRPPTIDHKRKYLRRLIDILDHCNGKQAISHVYDKKWGYIEDADVRKAYH